MDNKHIGYAVKSLHRRINQVIGRIPAIKENKNLTSVQIWILNFLFRNEGRDVFQKDIEAEFNTRRSTATELLKQMEKNGLIRRVCVDYDARLKKIVVTDHAEEIRKQIQTQIDKTEKTMTEGLYARGDRGVFRLCGTVQAKSRKMRIGHFERVGA